MISACDFFKYPRGKRACLIIKTLKSYIFTHDEIEVIKVVKAFKKDLRDNIVKTYTYDWYDYNPSSIRIPRLEPIIKDPRDDIVLSYYSVQK